MNEKLRSRLLSIFQNYIGKGNSIPSSRLYALLYGKNAFMAHSTLQRLNNIAAIKKARRGINHRERLHIVYERINGNYVFYVASNAAEAAKFEEKMGKIIKGIHKSIEHCNKYSNLQTVRAISRLDGKQGSKRSGF